MWPVQILRDRQENLFISDEGLHRITILSPDGTFLGKWGEQGAGPGQLNRPSGIAFDAEENVYVADTQNHRVQRFTRDGQHLATFGTPGQGQGELSMPWGVAVDADGDVYVADWGNDRIQKFSPQGRFLLQFGRSGSEPGELRGPAGLAVDADGDVYVADRGNHRVQQFDARGRFVDEFLGDATLSRSGRTYILANPKVLRGREMTALGPSKRLRGPAAVRLDEEGRTLHPGLRIAPHPGLQEGGLPPHPGGHLAGAEGALPLQRVTPSATCDALTPQPRRPLRGPPPERRGGAISFISGGPPTEIVFSDSPSPPWGEGAGG